MPDPYVSKRVFEVARDIKAPTNDIIEFLISTGYDVTRKQMHPVDERMYIAILHKFDRPRFEKYLTDRGITGEDLKRMINLLDEQTRRKETPPPPKPVYRAPIPKASREERPLIRRPVASEEPTNFKIIVKPRPVNPYIQLSSEPKEIATSPLTLDLIKRLLEMQHDQKIKILEHLRSL